MSRIGWRKAVLAAAGAWTLSAAAWAVPLPPVLMQGSIRYLSGGIGADEARAIRDEGLHWPLVLRFAVKDTSHGAFLADVDVQVHDALGRTVLDATSGGPVMLIGLAPGHYTVDATFLGQTLTRTFDLKPGGTAQGVFTWPHADDRLTG